MNFYLVVARGRLDDIPVRAFKGTKEGLKEAEAYAREQGREMDGTCELTSDILKARNALSLDTSHLFNISVYSFVGGILEGIDVIHAFE